MRRRFGRRRDSEEGAPIDTRAVFARLTEAEIIPAGVEPIAVEGVPERFAALGAGTGSDGRPVVVAWSRSGADAVLAALAAGAARLGEGGTALAVAPAFAPAARRMLSLAAPRAFSLEAREGGGAAAEPEVEALDDVLVLPASGVAARLADVHDRDLFARAAAGLAGLAAKHGGSVRGVGSTVELVLLARRVAVVRADHVLEGFVPRRSSDRIDSDNLADALDRLEGQLRKHLNDRKVREGEEGLRAGAIQAAARTAGLRSLLRWPLPGSDPERIDFLGLDAEGKPIAGAVRRRISLDGLARIVDACLALRAALPALLAGETPPVRIETPKLLLVADGFDDAALGTLAELSLEIERLPLGAASTETVSEGRGDGDSRPRGRRRRGRRDGRDRDERGGRDQEERAASDRQDRSASDREERGGRDREERGGRDREERAGGGRGRGARSAGARERDEAPARAERVDGDGRDPGPGDKRDEEERAAAAPRFAQLSAFDLADDDEPERPRRGRRRGGRRRRGGSGGSGGGEGSSDDADEAEPSASARETQGAADADADEEVVRSANGDDDGELVEPLEVEPEVEVAEEVLEIEEPPRLERPRRAAIVAHADRGSVAAGLLLAREVRSLEGFWVYSQEDLMTFFRGVATDLRGEVAIMVVGFTARPAFEVLQAASLYQGRMIWFDHHEWPPEDLEAMRRTLGEESVHVVPGLDSPLPIAVEQCTRRSRFTDKLVDLATARFTEHDFTRWGRLWWSRIGTLCERGGDRRGDIDGLLAGRPSDLAREASRHEVPPLPPELAWVRDRDFVLQHFGGYTLVQVPVEEGLNVHLAGRIARERHAAELSLAWMEGDDLMVLGGEDRFDVLAMVSHLATKQEWIEALPGNDHVARIRVRDLAEHLDDVVAEIAMGRSILNG